MGKRDRILIDTNIFIEYLKGSIIIKDLFLLRESTEFCYLNVIKKELLSKKGLKNSEKKKIMAILKNFKLIKLNNSILEKYEKLSKIYQKKGIKDLVDPLIAATCIIKNCQLLTFNQKHFNFLPELKIISLSS